MSSARSQRNKNSESEKRIFNVTATSEWLTTNTSAVLTPNDINYSIQHDFN